MGLFEALFGRKSADTVANATFKALTAYQPTFTSWGGKIYESELVRSAIDARARHISKLQVNVDGSAKTRLRTAVRSGPNEWQTWGQFLYRLSTILDVQNTAFIVPIRDVYGQICGYFPVLPSQCELVDVNGKAWIRYHFLNGNTAALPMAECGVMTKHQYADDFFGENNIALNGTMSLIDMNNQGIREGIKNSATFRFMAKMSNFAKADDIAKEAARFNRENLRAEGGILLFPNTYTDMKQLDSKPYTIDAEQMEQIRTNVYNYFGVNADILQNKAVGDSLDGFFDGAIEPFSVQLSDVMSRMTFTDREIANGNRVTVTADRLQYMSTASKISLAKEMGDRGILMIDEIRELFNYAPLPDGVGQHAPIRGEYYMVDEGKEGEADANVSGERVPVDDTDADQSGT